MTARGRLPSLIFLTPLALLFLAACSAPQLLASVRPLPTLVPTLALLPQPPTPRLTPPVAQNTATPEATATAIPPTPTTTHTPLPTATAVSAEAFQEEFSGLVDQFEELGVSEAQYREIVRNQIYRERLVEVLSVEDEISDVAEQASFFFLQFNTEEEANEALALVEASDYLSVWNEIRSTPFELESGSTAQASEIVWRTEDAVSTTLGAELTEAVFSLPIGETSDIISRTISTDSNQYYLIQVTGREERPLPPVNCKRLSWKTWPPSSTSS